MELDRYFKGKSKKMRIEATLIPFSLISKDWDSLLKSLAHLMFCITNKTQGNVISLPSTAEPPTTVSIMVGLTFDVHNGTDLPNDTHLGLTISGTKLGFRGE